MSQAKARRSTFPTKKYLGWCRLKYQRIFHHQITNHSFCSSSELVTSPSRWSLLQYPTWAPLSNTQASVFWAALKCTIWHHQVATNLPCAFYNKWGCNFLAIAEARVTSWHWVALHTYRQKKASQPSWMPNNMGYTATSKRKHHLQYFLIPLTPEDWKHNPEQIRCRLNDTDRTFIIRRAQFRVQREPSQLTQNSLFTLPHAWSKGEESLFSKEKKFNRWQGSLGRCCTGSYF